MVQYRDTPNIEMGNQWDEVLWRWRTHPCFQCRNPPRPSLLMSIMAPGQYPSQPHFQLHDPTWPCLLRIARMSVVHNPVLLLIRSRASPWASSLETVPCQDPTQPHLIFSLLTCLVWPSYVMFIAAWLQDWNNEKRGWIVQNWQPNLIFSLLTGFLWSSCPLAAWPQDWNNESEARLCKKKKILKWKPDLTFNFMTYHELAH